MARPMSDGLRYFPFDVDFFSDLKIKSLRARYGRDGIAAYIYILCEIYRGGYYVMFDEYFADCAAADLGLSVELVQELAEFFCKRGLFDSGLFSESGALTSRAVQSRYQEARKGAKREVLVDEKLWLLTPEETEPHIVFRYSGDNSGKNAGNSGNYSAKEKKEKERKTEESRAEETYCTPSAPHSRSVAVTQEYGADKHEPDSMKASLEERYGAGNVAEYEQRYSRWAESRGISPERTGDMYRIIGRWLEQDGATKPPEPRIPEDDIMEELIRQYQQGF